MNEKNIEKAKSETQNSYLAAFKDLEHRMENMFQNMWSNPFHHDKLPDTFSFSSLSKMPKIDVIDRDKEIFVKAELPGFDKDDLDISIANNQLVIKAKTCKEEKEEKGDYYRCEISQGAYSRTVGLPSYVDADKAKANFKDGILELTLPKVEKSKRRTIEVK